MARRYGNDFESSEEEEIYNPEMNGGRYTQNSSKSNSEYDNNDSFLSGKKE